MIAGIRLNDIVNVGELYLAGEIDEKQILALEVRGFAIDSRVSGSGDLFFALRGERVDGHDFIDEVASKGAVAAVVEERQQVALPQICVDQVPRALAEMAGVIRQQFSGTVIGITGSSGKTMVKNMVKTVLSQTAKTSATSGNLNNEIGVPLSIAAIDAAADFAVLEMGAAQQGDIAYLCEFAKPNIAVVNNVGHAHVGRFGGIEITAKTKGEIYRYLSTGDTAIVNLDDRFADLWLSELQKGAHSPEVLTFSLYKPQANVFLVAPEGGLEESETLTVIIRRTDDGIGDGTQVTVQRVAPGQHNVANTLAAIAIAVAAGLSNEQIVQGFLVPLEQDAGRLVHKKTLSGIELIDDSYNANPESLKVAIDYLAAYAVKHHLAAVLVLGDMAELGEQAESCHHQAGEYAAKAGVDRLYCCGCYAHEYASGFSQYAKTQQSASVSIDQQQLVVSLKEQLSSGIVVLVKGSRSSAMDKVVNAFSHAENEVPSC